MGIKAGVTAIVVSAADDDNLNVAQMIINDSDDGSKEQNIEIIWRVSTPEQVEKIVDSGMGHAFLISNNVDTDGIEKNVEAILDAIPNKAVIISSVNAMQKGNGEIEKGKALKKLGVASILVREACIGDAEDVEYSTFVVNGLTSKASSEFQLTGLTGSTNGHFGGVAEKGAKTWKRNK